MVKTRTFVPTAPGIHTGIRLLDLATGGGRLLADSREGVSLINQGSLSVTPLPGTLLHRGAETEFIEYSTATGKVGRVLGHWTFGSVGGLSINVLWSNASGSVLIGVIPGGDNGRAGVISGNEFTPLPLPTAVSGTW